MILQEQDLADPYQVEALQKVYNSTNYQKRLTLMEKDRKITLLRLRQESSNMATEPIFKFRAADDPSPIGVTGQSSSD